MLCVEFVWELGCGCCLVCVWLEGEVCGVYILCCGQGLCCYFYLGFELFLQVLVMGEGICEKCWDVEYGVSLEQVVDNGDDYLEGGLVENYVDSIMNMLGGGGSVGWKFFKLGMKELVVFWEKVIEQYWQMGKGGKYYFGLEEFKKL